MATTKLQQLGQQYKAGDLSDQQYNAALKKSGLFQNKTTGAWTDAEGGYVDIVSGKNIETPMTTKYYSLGTDKGAEGKSGIPAGYQMTPGGVKPIPGGPADPRVTTEKSLEETYGTAESDLFKEFQSTVGSLAQQVGGLTEGVGVMQQSLTESYKSLMKSMEAQGEMFSQQLSEFMKQTGQAVDLTNKALQDELLAARAAGEENFSGIFEKYAVDPKELANRSQEANYEQLAELGRRAVETGQITTEQAEDAIKRAKTDALYFARDAEAYFRRFIDEKDPMTQEDVDKMSTDIRPSTNEAGEFELSVNDQFSNALDEIGTREGEGVFDILSSAGFDINNMSSIEMMNALLLQRGLEISQNDDMQDYLTKMQRSYEESWRDAQSLYGPGGTAITEIDKAISGEDFIPSTYEGLAAKIYKEQRDYNTTNVELEREWRQTQYDTWFGQEMDKRGRLEGYLRAKLYAAGAQDSSAGLSLMSLQVNAADLRLQLAQGEHNFAISKLNNESRNIMNTYTNNIVKLGLDAETKLGEAEKTYNAKLLEVEGLKIEDEREKQKMALDALSTFSDRMYQIDQDKKNWEWKYSQQAYQETQDAINNSYKLSGLTGTVHVVDENNAVYDTGIPTFDAQKWEQTQWFDWAKFNHQKQYDAFGLGIDMLEAGFDPMSIANMTGLDPALLANYGTDSDAVLEALYDVQAERSWTDRALGFVEDKVTSNLYKYEGKGDTELGIPDIDPMSFSDIRESFNNMGDLVGSITQGFDTPVDYIAGRSTHGGYDVVFKDGMVHSFTDGVVVDVIPDPNPGAKAGWGARVIIQDGQGRRWQYAHFLNSGVDVRKGDRVKQGQSIGAQGNGGYSFSTSGGSGAHLDFRLVGYNPVQSPNPAWFDSIVSDYATAKYSEAQAKSLIEDATDDTAEAEKYQRRFSAMLDVNYENPELPKWAEPYRDLLTSAGEKTLREMNENQDIIADLRKDEKEARLEYEKYYKGSYDTFEDYMKAVKDAKLFKSTF